MCTEQHSLSAHTTLVRTVCHVGFERKTQHSLLIQVLGAHRMKNGAPIIIELHLANTKLGKKIHIKTHMKIDHTILLESFEQLYYVLPLFKNSCKKRHWSGLFSTLSINTAYQVL
ncbi:hypothetical protein KIL84_017564 [Mauremys mutica]|uniref:Uncharacterized protein n=1 Tax=Mauremys mutica TaxID=74926 RepID=A0A9D3X6R1_9SAUR|nr:hypothetical protein KIL84_017564 [Mauremys mutica]